MWHFACLSSAAARPVARINQQQRAKSLFLSEPEDSTCGPPQPATTTPATTATARDTWKTRRSLCLSCRSSQTSYAVFRIVVKATAGVCVGGVIILQLIESGSNLSEKVVVMLLKRLLRTSEISRLEKLEEGSKIRFQTLLYLLLGTNPALI